jgi:hypothetical protein
MVTLDPTTVIQPSLHSITASARCSIDCGTVRPSALPASVPGTVAAGLATALASPGSPVAAEHAATFGTDRPRSWPLDRGKRRFLAFVEFYRGHRCALERSVWLATYGQGYRNRAHSPNRRARAAHCPVAQMRVQASVRQAYSPTSRVEEASDRVAGVRQHQRESGEMPMPV